MQRHITSVFSEYEAMDNNSANSKQLQYWLKQVSNPLSTPNLGFQWTFMTNQSSSFQRPNHYTSNHLSQQAVDDVSFGKTVHSSIDRDKENNSMVSNGNKGHNVQSKSKSYVNAMIALQKKVKTLEDQNIFMRKNMVKMHEQKNRSMSDSMANEEQLKAKLNLIQPRLAKIDELIEQNKVLRVNRDEKSRKVKILEKSNGQLVKKLQFLTQQITLLKKSEQQIRQKSQKSLKKISELEQELQKQYTRNKALEEMKQKSTVSILQKYNKSIEYTQQIEKQNVKLKNQLHYLKNKYNEDIKNINEGHKNQIIKCQVQFQKLKESVGIKDGLIQEKKRQAQYFRDAYEKKDEEFMELIRSHHKVNQEEKSQIKKLEEQLQKNNAKINKLEMKKDSDLKQILKIAQEKQIQKEKQKQKERLKQKQQNRAIIKIQNQKNQSKQSSVIELPQTLVPNISPHQKRSFEGFVSEEQQQEFEQSLIPISIETKSVGKPAKKKKSQRKQVLSSQSRRVDSKTHKNSQQKNIRTNLASPKQHKKISKKKRVIDQEDASFTMKSCQPPKTQPMHRITFQDNLGHSRIDEQKQNKVVSSYYYSAHQYPPLPHPSYRNMNNACEQIHDFHCRNNASCQSIDQAMLIQLQKQLLQLYEEQQNLILASNNELATQAERSEYVGRLKQINQHLRLKNQKICELKSKI